MTLTVALAPQALQNEPVPQWFEIGQALFACAHRIRRELLQFRSVAAKPHRCRWTVLQRFLRTELAAHLFSQTILGHRLGSMVTEIYAEANVRKARQVIAQVG